MKSKTNISVVSNTGIRRKSEVIIGDSGPYTSGDILDANATQELINSGGGAGGDAMPIVYLDDDEEGTLNLEVGKCYKVNFDLHDIDFVLSAPLSPEYVQHIIILGYLSTSMDNVGFITGEYDIKQQPSTSMSQGGLYRIDCMFVGDAWLVTYTVVEPDEDPR